MLFVVFILFSLILSTQQINIQSENVNPKNKPQPEEPKDINSSKDQSLPAIKIMKKIKTNATSTNITQNQTANNVVAQGLPKINKTLEEKTIEVEPGAITRGIIVFLGIAILFLFCAGMKTYGPSCRRKKQDKSRTIVCKYGVRTSRGDVEMEPLPLSDEDEDETVFDLVSSRNSTSH